MLGWPATEGGRERWRRERVGKSDNYTTIPPINTFSVIINAHSGSCLHTDMKSASISIFIFIAFAISIFNSIYDLGFSPLKTTLQICVKFIRFNDPPKTCDQTSHTFMVLMLVFVLLGAFGCAV